MAAIWIIVAVVVVALVVVARWRCAPAAGRRRAASAGTPGAGTLTRPRERRPTRCANRPCPAAEAPAAEPVALRVRERLGRARGLFSPVRAVRGRARSTRDLEQIEDALLRADVGVGTADALLADLRSRWVRVSPGTDGLLDALSLGPRPAPLGARRGDLRRRGRPRLGWWRPTRAPRHDGAAAATAGAGAGDGAVRSGRQLHFDQAADVTNVWLFVGVNGVGKTTTVGKVARQEAPRAARAARAGDTFRAAAGEQLPSGRSARSRDRARGRGGDPSAIVFDAVQRRRRVAMTWCWPTPPGACTRSDLVEELKKIRRVADRPPAW